MQKLNVTLVVDDIIEQLKKDGFFNKSALVTEHEFRVCFKKLVLLYEDQPDYALDNMAMFIDIATKQVVESSIDKGVKTLIERGAVEEAGIDENGDTQYKLTDKGVEAAKALFKPRENDDELEENK